MKKISAVFFLTLFIYPMLSHSFDMGSGLMPPRMQKTMIAFTGSLHESTDVGNQSASIQYGSLFASVPVYKTDEEVVSLSVSGAELSLKPSIDSQSNFYDIKFGGAFTKVVDDARLWSVATRYGSASDEPFADNSVSTFGITAFYSYPSASNPNAKWMLLADYSNNRTFLNSLPLPGFAYFYTPSKDFRGIFGLPFVSIYWAFSEKFSLDYFGLFPWTHRGSLNFHLNPVTRIFAGFDFSQMTFYLLDRGEKKERLFYDQKTLFIGARSPLSKTVFAELQLGHAFDRALFSSENYTRSPEDPIEMGNSFYIKTSLRFAF